MENIIATYLSVWSVAVLAAITVNLTWTRGFIALGVISIPFLIFAGIKLRAKVKASNERRKQELIEKEEKRQVEQAKEKQEQVEQNIRWTAEAKQKEEKLAKEIVELPCHNFNVNNEDSQSTPICPKCGRFYNTRREFLEGYRQKCLCHQCNYKWIMRAKDEQDPMDDLVSINLPIKIANGKVAAIDVKPKEENSEKDVVSNSKNLQVEGCYCPGKEGEVYEVVSTGFVYSDLSDDDEVQSWLHEDVMGSKEIIKKSHRDYWKEIDFKVYKGIVGKRLWRINYCGNDVVLMKTRKEEGCDAYWFIEEEGIRLFEEPIESAPVESNGEKLKPVELPPVEVSPDILYWSKEGWTHVFGDRNAKFAEYELTDTNGIYRNFGLDYIVNTCGFADKDSILKAITQEHWDNINFEPLNHIQGLMIMTFLHPVSGKRLALLNFGSKENDKVRRPYAVVDLNCIRTVKGTNK